MRRPSRLVPTKNRLRQTDHDNGSGPLNVEEELFLMQKEPPAFQRGAFDRALVPVGGRGRVKALGHEEAQIGDQGGQGKGVSSDHVHGNFPSSFFAVRGLFPPSWYGPFIAEPV